LKVPSPSVRPVINQGFISKFGFPIVSKLLLVFKLEKSFVAFKENLIGIVVANKPRRGVFKIE
jgi:hypothetical protein